MIKLVLCGIILVFSALAGFSKASVYSQRVELLSCLITNLKYLEAEMEYSGEPVPFLLQRIGERGEGPWGEFFQKTARLLSERRAKSLREAWNMGLTAALPQDVLTEEDFRILMELGYELGSTDMASQKAIFAHCFEGLKRQEDEARQEAFRQGRMYRGLGISAGILTVVLLL